MDSVFWKLTTWINNHPVGCLECEVEFKNPGHVTVTDPQKEIILIENKKMEKVQTWIEMSPLKGYLIFLLLFYPEYYESI